MPLTDETPELEPSGVEHARPLHSPSRVCLLIGQLGLGGAEKQLVLLAKGLSARGIRTHLLVLFERGAREEDLRDSGVSVVDLGFRRRSLGRRSVVGNVRAFVRLVSFLRRERPQVLQAFLFHAYLLAAPAARMARVPVLVAGRRSLGFFKKGNRPALALEKISTRWTDFLVANATAIADEVRQDEGVPAAKISVIPNGMPRNEFEPAEPAEVLTSLPVVLCVANLAAHKGHRYLLEACAALQRTGSPCTLVLIGDGPERLTLQRLANRLDLDARFLGARADVAGFLARADAVVLPSLYEGSSNAVMEAMAAGRPVVATGVGGTPELLEGRGVLVPPADADALADGIRQVLTDREAATALGRRARAWALANLTADVMVDRYLALYRHLLERRSTS
ncbi:glycosyltransferase [Streptomyces tropicalis]|uniref:D-inositol 3-phosphate glycosyltransferase n=1 Tax=Streptomyces tropicalis TaxID=3034234 RepID=A0ABT5ZZ08_9ACTN|nr:glycosyltransferase [Streptomyces tropicalis]MDF3297623.1 glycosyltransferase [Streptomyces tropicalis]